MFKFNKKIAIIALSCICAISTLTGCGNSKKQEPEVTYELKKVDSSQLKSGKIYVKDGDGFYECPTGTTTFENAVSDKADNSRVIMFGKDDVMIPTLYKDQQLVYVTKDTPSSFTWERYEDEGYTVGVVGLQATSTNKYSLTVDPKYLLDGSSLRTLMGENGLKSGDQVIFNKVNDTTITNKNISKGGSILGLTQGDAYSLDLYKGSEYTSLTNVVADTHVFSNFEVFTSEDFEYAEADYIVIDVPDTLMSGYYYVSQLGFVRYVNGSAADGDKNVNFNTPYYYYDEEGTQYTYDEIKTDANSDTNKDDSKKDEKEIDAADAYTNTTYVDCSNEQMTISITYQDATTKINGKDTAISDTEAGYPTAKLTGPDGTSYLFTASNQSEKTLTCTVENPMIGEWTTTIGNISQRKFAVNTEFKSGHSDTLIHKGSGTQEMTYYLKDNMAKGLFAITWENKSRAATVEVTAPDGTEYSKDIDPNCVYADGYGYIELVLGELNYGDYKISVTGDDLGRVRCQSEDISATGTPTIKIDTTESKAQ